MDLSKLASGAGSAVDWRLEDMDSSSWKLRDTSHLLLSRRDMTRTTTAAAVIAANNQMLMPTSSHFDTDTCLARIRRDKAVIVRRAFDAGAIAVLKAFEKSRKNDNNDDDDDDDDDDDEEEMDDTDEEDDDDDDDDDNLGGYLGKKKRKKKNKIKLPHLVKQWKELEKLRMESMDRAHNNKEYAKNNPTTGTNAAASTKTKKAPAKKATTTAAASASAEGGGKKKGKATKAATGANKKGAGGEGGGGKKKSGGSSTAPKFTRNTPASSAAALDSRSTSSRAILCTAGNVAFDAITPSFPSNRGHDINVVDVPQNTAKTGTTITTVVVNMGAVVVEAQTLGQRAISVADNAVRRATNRYQYRKDNICFSHAITRNHYYHHNNHSFLTMTCRTSNNKKATTKTISYFQLKNPFAWKDETTDTKTGTNKSTNNGDESPSRSLGYFDDDPNEDDDADGSATGMNNNDNSNIDSIMEEVMIRYQPNEESITETWMKDCLPRFLRVLQTGSGHALYHDISWSTRHGRIAHLLQSLTKGTSSNEEDSKEKDNNTSTHNYYNNHKYEYFGPHLIVTTEPEVIRFAQEFNYVNSHMRLLSTKKSSTAARSATTTTTTSATTKISEAAATTTDDSDDDDDDDDSDSDDDEDTSSDDDEDSDEDITSDRRRKQKKKKRKKHKKQQQQLLQSQEEEESDDDDDDEEEQPLRALMYLNSDSHLRKKIRQYFFDKTTGLSDAPYHVLITSYSTFLQDYIHFCQIPFEVVILDDGISFMSCAVNDPNSSLGQMWENSIWSTKDQQIGLAGTSYNEVKHTSSSNNSSTTNTTADGVPNKNGTWDFSLDFGSEDHNNQDDNMENDDGNNNNGKGAGSNSDNKNSSIPKDVLKDAWIGLTTRHRILTGAKMKIQHRNNSVDLVPVSGLVNFIAPHFADVVREEWDRSRIHSDLASMEHFRKLLTRSTIVHYHNPTITAGAGSDDDDEDDEDEEEENSYFYNNNNDDDEDGNNNTMKKKKKKRAEDSDVVALTEENVGDMHVLALLALKGKLPNPDRGGGNGSAFHHYHHHDQYSDPEVPQVIADESFVKEGKVAHSRRSSLLWLGSLSSSSSSQSSHTYMSMDDDMDMMGNAGGSSTMNITTSWLRYELGIANFQPILDIMNNSNTYGHFCEEIITASSTTSSGATGQVTGTLAYRLAVRCCRHFGSEQGLRQHLSALHAPPGTWLCRTCGIDCITSQARTHHERSCGQPSSGMGGAEQGSGGGSGAGANATVGKGGGGGSGSGGRQHHHGPVGVVGKKKGQKVQNVGAISAKDKDPDGSFRVPGYRGVWVNQKGKHFVKIDEKRLSKLEAEKATMGDKDDDDSNNDNDDDNKDNSTLFFDNIDEAARMHDEVIKAREKKGKKKSKDSKTPAQLNFKPDGTRIIYEDITPASTTGLGGSASNVVPALSVINIKDLPPDVKPLLRDPRQTSRTGGNSKRHVYAYRGVCRQARKGHDRWQSQISFMGVNHYLGTFDSEWDAAAIYAWAHLILYGEEATKKAQKEGEEAAAAYEQEKKDIAEGKIPPPPPKPEKKKKKKPGNKKDENKTESGSKGEDKKEGNTSSSQKKRKNPSGNRDGGSPTSEVNSSKKARVTSKVDKEAIAPTLAKGVTKTTVLALRDDFKEKSDEELFENVAQRLDAVHESGYCVSDVAVGLYSHIDDRVRPCLPVSSMSSTAGGAMLLGLSSFLFGWDIDTFINSRRHVLFDLMKDGDDDEDEDDIERKVHSTLTAEFGHNGFNESFRTLLLGSSCIIGNASKQAIGAYESLGLGTIPIGGAVGDIDCHIGGVPSSCSEGAAYIEYAPTNASEFQFSCVSSSSEYEESEDNIDIVTLNGKRITTDMGSFPLFNEDICTVGARVFVFLLPVDT